MEQKHIIMLIVAVIGIVATVYTQDLLAKSASSIMFLDSPLPLQLPQVLLMALTLCPSAWLMHWLDNNWQPR